MPDGGRRDGALPLLTLGVVGAACLLWATGAGDALVFDRDAIERGAVWRLVTGNWVHFSVAQLLLDGGTLLVAGALVERRRRRELLALIVASAFASGLAVLLWEPETVRFGGLSGVAVSAVVYAALAAGRDHDVPRWIGWLIVAAVAVRIGRDALVPRSLTAADGTLVHVSAAAHAAGLAVGVLLHVATRRGRHRHGCGVAEATNRPASAPRPVARSSAA